MNLTGNFDKLGSGEGKEIYSAPNGARNICFIQTDGSSEFYNYAYLIKGGFKPEESVIELQFTTAIVTIKGQNLATLYQQLMSHMRKNLVCQEQRYAATLASKEAIAFEIIIT